MPPDAALLIVAALLTVAVLGGAALRRRDGRRRTVRARRFDPEHAHPASLGARATLVQFSTEMCARCPQVRRMLREIVSADDGLRHVEVDLTHRPDLSAHYRVLQTPTTFLVDRAGVVRSRFSGVPQRQALTDALAAL